MPARYRAGRDEGAAGALARWGMRQALERRAAELRTGPVLHVSVTGSGLGATDRVAQVLPAEPLPGGPACGVLAWDHTYGGSVPEGVRSVVAVVLADALVEAEDFDADPVAATTVRIFAADPARRAALAAVVRAALGLP